MRLSIGLLFFGEASRYRAAKLLHSRRELQVAAEGDSVADIVKGGPIWRRFKICANLRLVFAKSGAVAFSFKTLFSR